MLIKHAIITALATLGLIVLIALGIAVYRHDVGVQSLFECIWGTSFGFALLGLLARSGAATGDTVVRTEAIDRTTQNREGYYQADGADAQTGFAFGTVVMLSALVVFGASLAVLYGFFDK